jgi:hypothetical protein
VASGGGGGDGESSHSGAGGGGSGGAILLEGAELDIDGTAVVSANGGAGGAGQPAGFTDPTSAPGGDGVAGTDQALGGLAVGSGGDGGAGAARDLPATAGQDGGTVLTTGAGGGGGGGGVGRIQLNRAASCLVRGLFSPQADVACPDCGACPSSPAIGCAPSMRSNRLYYFCPSALDWNAARESCAAKAMTLVSISDEAQNDWLFAMIGVETWIGASDSAAEGEWYWDGQSSAFWLGSASGAAQNGAYVAWPADEPNDGPDPNSDCAVISPGTGYWHDRACTDVHPYVCQP